LIADVVGDLFQMMEEGFLVSLSCWVVEIRHIAWLVRTDDYEGGCDSPFGGKETFHENRGWVLEYG
jgi:hypothetical protein